LKKIINLIWSIKFKIIKTLSKEPRKKKQWGWNRKKQIKSISHLKKLKEWESNPRYEKLEDKIEKTFQFEVIFSNKTGLNLKRKEVQGLLCFFPTGNAKTKLFEREMTGIKKNWTSIKPNIIFMHTLLKDNGVADTCCSNVNSLLFFYVSKDNINPKTK